MVTVPPMKRMAVMLCFQRYLVSAFTKFGGLDKNCRHLSQQYCPRRVTLVRGTQRYTGSMSSSEASMQRLRVKEILEGDKIEAMVGQEIIVKGWCVYGYLELFAWCHHC